MELNPNKLEEELHKADLPVITVRVDGGNLVPEFSAVLNEEQSAQASAILANHMNGLRIKSINEEADKRVAAITGDQTAINQDLALAVGLMYAELRPQLSPATQARLDPVAAKSQAANSIRLQAAAMIANPQLTWE